MHSADSRRYMSGPKADAILARSTDPTIKKKRKKVKNEDYVGGSSASKGEAKGLMLKDEDEKRVGDEDEDMEGEDAPGQCLHASGSYSATGLVSMGVDVCPIVIGKDIATFKKSSSAWATVGSTSLALPAGHNSEAGPSTLKAEDTKPDPDAEGTNGESFAPKPQITKRKGGLRTAAQLKAEVEAAAAARSPSPELPPDAPDPTKTVHRDTSGRVMDVEKLRAEQRAQELEEERKKKEKEEWSKGLVQRQNQEARRREEREMGERDVAR